MGLFNHFIISFDAAYQLQTNIYIVSLRFLTSTYILIFFSYSKTNMSFLKFTRNDLCAHVVENCFKGLKAPLEPVATCQVLISSFRRALFSIKKEL